MNTDIKARWIEALRSGEYAQGMHVLRSPGDAYCCLGVLCDIAVKDGKGEWYDLAPDEGGEHWNFRDEADGFSSTGLTRKIKDWSGIGFLDQDTLVHMNDGQGRSFKEIAQYIEENL